MQTSKCAQGLELRSPSISSSNQTWMEINNEHILSFELLEPAEVCVSISPKFSLSFFLSLSLPPLLLTPATISIQFQVLKYLAPLSPNFC